MTDTAKAIAEDAARLGIKSGDVILIHSSLKSLGGKAVTPDDVIQGLQSAVGKDGTLIFPTLSYTFCNAAQPIYNVRTTPACTGAVADYARTLPDAERSLCPTHSCTAIGPLAKQLCEKQHLDGTPCGPHSAFAMLPSLGGSVLFIGCGCGCNTSMHAVEEEFTPPYLFGDDVEYTVTDKNGLQSKITCRAHNFKGVRQQYTRAADSMTHGVHSGSILAAQCILLEAKPMWEAARKLLSQDPFALVSQI